MMQHRRPVPFIERLRKQRDVGAIDAEAAIHHPLPGFAEIRSIEPHRSACHSQRELLRGLVAQRQLAGRPRAEVAIVLEPPRQVCEDL